jgi:hypothetical protein
MRLADLCITNESFEVTIPIDGERIDFIWDPRCSVCLRKSPDVTAHTAVKCPLVGTMNKVRAAAGLVPLTLVVHDKWVRSDESRPYDVAAEVKKVSARVDDHDKRIGKLETGSGSKVQGNGKRKEAPTAAQGGTAKKAKKSKGKAAKQAPGGKAKAEGSGKAQAQAKGKGKAKA